MSDNEAIAVLFGIDPDRAGNVYYNIFRESDVDALADPLTRAESLMISFQEDFPETRLWAFTGNVRARQLHRTEHE